MTKRIWVVLASLWFFGTGIAYGSVTSGSASRYDIRSDITGMPHVVVLRHCSPEEDSYTGPLHTVIFEHGKRLVLRCTIP